MSTLNENAKFTTDSITPLGICDDQENALSSITMIKKTIRSEEKFINITSYTVSTLFFIHGKMFQINTHSVDRHAQSREETIAFQRKLIKSILEANSKPAGS